MLDWHSCQTCYPLEIKILLLLLLYLQIMTKTRVMSEKDWHKTAGGVAHTRHPLSIHFNILKTKK